MPQAVSFRLLLLSTLIAPAAFAQGTSCSVAPPNLRPLSGLPPPAPYANAPTLPASPAAQAPAMAGPAPARQMAMPAPIMLPPAVALAAPVALAASVVAPAVPAALAATVGVVAPAAATISPTGQFSVQDGNFYDPKGNVFNGQGINVFPGQVDAATILSTFPGIQTVRVASTLDTDPGQLDALVQGLTAQGVVVLIEDHSSAGAAFSPGGNNVLTGQALTDETNWYAGLAGKYKANPYVWFGTANEPDAPGNPGLIAQQQIATYNAIRGTGSNAMVLLEGRGGFTMDFAKPYAADYAKMTNVGADTHFYGWVPNFSTNQDAIGTSFLNQVGDAQSIQSANGKMPVYVGEFGISTTGSGADANGTQVVQTVLNSGVASAAWAWNAGDDAVTNGNTVTPFGQQVVSALAKK